MFDSTMNYDFRRHCLRFFARGELDAAGFAARCGDMLMRYKKQMSGVQLNLLDSHDVPRFLTLCGGDRRRYKLALLFMFSFVGMPMLFYGDELGMEGLEELDYRAPMPWGGGDRELCGFICRLAALRPRTRRAAPRGLPRKARLRRPPGLRTPAGRRASDRRPQRLGQGGAAARRRRPAAVGGGPRR